MNLPGRMLLLLPDGTSLHGHNSHRNRTWAANSVLTIVLLDPFVLPVGRLKDSQTYHVRREAPDQLRAVVVRLAAEFDVVHINTQDRFDAAFAATPTDC
jgi:hypothetical protein